MQLKNFSLSRRRYATRNSVLKKYEMPESRFASLIKNLTMTCSYFVELFKSKKRIFYFYYFFHEMVSIVKLLFLQLSWGIVDQHF